MVNSILTVAATLAACWLFVFLVIVFVFKLERGANETDSRGHGRTLKENDDGN